jgi:hypothetical protein
MNNDPELNGKYLGTITKDFAAVSDTLKEASYQIRKRGFSDYPIFPVSKQEIPIGRLLLGKYEMNDLEWDFYASFLDEFVQRKIVLKENIESFKEAYRDADEYCCLFVVDKDFVNFIFIPFPED